MSIRVINEHCTRTQNVCFTPDSGHSSAQVGCPLCAISRRRDSTFVRATSKADVAAMIGGTREGIAIPIPGTGCAKR